MGDRTQVILVITGLGATPVDPHPLASLQTGDFTVPSKPSAPRVASSRPLEVYAAPRDLEIPAFLRRRLARG